MKNFFLFWIAAIVGIYFLELQIVKHYTPSAESLRRITPVTGKLVVLHHRGGPTPELNSIPLMCGVSFLGPNDDCTRRVHGLTPGVEITAEIANVPTLIYAGRVVMSITVNGQQVYAATTNQVIDGYVESSRNGLPTGPILVLVLGLLRLWYSDKCIAFVSSLFK